MKTCTQCKIEKPLDQFVLKKSGAPERRAACKECTDKKNKEYRLTHKEEISKTGKEYKLNNKEKISAQGKVYSRKIDIRFSSSKSQAKKRKIEWDLTLEQFEKLISQPCYYCNNLLGKMVETSSGIDRIDNLVCYTFDNCVSCCKICNTIKGPYLSMEEAVAAIKAVLRVRFS